MATSATMASSSFTVSENSVTVGNYVDGPAYMVHPGGSLTLTGVTPTQSTDNGQVINGAVYNPQYSPGLGTSDQGFDSRMDATLNAKYSSGLTLGYNQALSVGDIIAKSVANVTVDVTNASARREGILDEINVCHIVASAPATEEFSPCCWGWGGRGTPASFTLNDTLDNIVDALPSYALVGLDVPTAAAVISNIDIFDPWYGKHINTNNAQGNAYEVMSVRKGQSNYGKGMGTTYGAAGLMLISDGATDAQKKTLLTRMISQGIQYFGAKIANSDDWGGDGAHHQFHHIPVAFALNHTTNLGDLADLNTIGPGNCMGQSFQITQSNIDNDYVPHDESNTATAKPAVFKRNAVTNVSGLAITTGQGLDCRALEMVRESDGATAIVVSEAGSVKTIDAQPSPAFATSDVIYFRHGWSIVAGDYDWDIRGIARVGNINEYNPSPDANYRNGTGGLSLNAYDEEVMVLHAAGLWDSSFDHMQGYVEKCANADDPSAAGDYYRHRQTYDGHSFSEDFWDTHWATIKANIGGGSVSATKQRLGSVSLIGSDGLGLVG